MIDPTSCDWCDDNTTRAQRKRDNKWLLRFAFIVLGFGLFTLILCGV